jgi:hypothetical protein
MKKDWDVVDSTGKFSERITQELQPDNRHDKKNYFADRIYVIAFYGH